MVAQLGERSDAVPDAVGEAAARHRDERALSVLVPVIGGIGLVGRFDVTIRRLAGSWG